MAYTSSNLFNRFQPLGVFGFWHKAGDNFMMQMYGMSGERLGTIGQEPEGLSWKLPAWKQDFLAKPSVSIRRGIAWAAHVCQSYNPPYEDTDTLVLTAPSGEFVDIRFPKDATSSREASDHRSYWAFSGEALTTFHDAGAQQHAIDMPYTAHCRFVHVIDSRGHESIASGDEGDMFLLMNGDCLEMGTMLNPLSRQKELYKEYWHSGEHLPDQNGVDDANTCIVAHVSSSAAVEGVIIRLGGRVQGIISRRDEGGSQILEVERWVRETSQHGKPIEQYSTDAAGGPWSRDIRSSGFLPVGWLSIRDRQVGDNIEHNGILWQVTEVHH